MPELITYLNSEYGTSLLIRGEDPAEILRLAVAWVAEEEDPEWVRIPDSVADVRVESIRTIGWCPIWECGCDRPGVHYIGAVKGSRGSFRGAFIDLHHITTEEMQALKAEEAARV